MAIDVENLCRQFFCKCYFSIKTFTFACIGYYYERLAQQFWYRKPYCCVYMTVINCAFKKINHIYFDQALIKIHILRRSINDYYLEIIFFFKCSICFFAKKMSNNIVINNLGHCETEKFSEKHFWTFCFGDLKWSICTD